MESGTKWGRRLRLDATGADSDGSVRILGGRALSWRATVASGTSPASRGSSASDRRHQPSGPTLSTHRRAIPGRTDAQRRVPT